jgi:hypothetical protein
MLEDAMPEAQLCGRRETGTSDKHDHDRRLSQGRTAH